ncbi:MAG: NAD-dependent epimerase/dehydratase family protein [Terriglobia bacterium]
MTSNRILVTGGTGFIGQHLVDQLLAEGASVRVLTRGSRPLAKKWANVEIVAGDLRSASTLGAAVQGCRIVYHLAGELRDPTHFQATNIEGTKRLLAACQASLVEEVIILSSVGVMGVRKPGSANENTSCRPRSTYERSKYAAEQLALAWSARTDIPVAVLRPTTVFGEGARPYGDSVLSWMKAIQSGHYVNFDEKAIANYVYVGDVVAACLRAAHSRAKGVFIISDSCLLTEFVAAIAGALGIAAPTRVVPLPLGYAVAFCMQALGRLLPNNFPRLTVARVRALSSRTRYISAQVESALNWHPEIGYRVGLERTVSWYRQSGLLGGAS